ncbi:hypothetical protein EUGRSUZ_K02313 [Eucalyptus grandis]|uniref:Uncharacterized protein n=2 Tax=Eucalyptus grandis TaxID=71139 RepID=A0ACC3IXK2_EUCGR|nr:hypothetical protein EUGRSUZ_K02313 [Eucalyptus grandis]
MSPASRSCGNISGAADGYGYIEHEVSRMDTLAGIAIKYGVEVADIKRINGLATDFQIFALKTLRIPLPGRHPPSASLPNTAASSGDISAEKASSSAGHYNLSKSSELFKCKSSQQKASPFISSSRYYGVKLSNSKGLAEGEGMTIYGLGTSCIHNNRLKGHELPASDSTSKHQKMGSGFLAENGSIVDYTSIFDVIDTEGEGSNTKSTRNYQETKAGSPNAKPEKLLKEENVGGNSSFLPTRGKALALRAKSASRTSLAIDAESNWTSPVRAGAVDDIITTEHPGLQKASSVSSLQVQDATNSSSIWQTSKWSLKPDLPLFSAASLTGPILDGLALPISFSGWRSKAALD